MATYLPAIERPQGLVKKLVYAISRRQFGNVSTPVQGADSQTTTATATAPLKLTIGGPK
jgi:hypothetical protein